jgi:hypothetical protein
MKYIALSLLLVAGAVNAQGFAPLTPSDPGDVCYSWEGGHKSAGSYSRCSPQVYVKPAKPVAVAAPVPQPVVMQNTVCPPQIILEPETKKKRYYKPRPKPVCK